MSALFYPYRHHHRQVSPWAYSRTTPSSFAISPFYSRPAQHESDPFGFSQPFLSLFNDTFNQLDRLSSDLDSHLSQTFGASTDNPSTNWQKLLTSTPKFDVKETDSNYMLEGELPGVSKKDISLTWADDHTLVLKTHTSSFKEQKPDAPQPSENANAKQIDSTEKKSPTEMNAQASEGSAKASAGDDTAATATAATSNAVATTDNKTADVAKLASSQPTYHLTERTHSTFQRVFSFAGQVKHDEVKAGLKNGVLTVTIPKVSPEPAKEQKVRNVIVEDAEEGQDAEMVDAEKAKL